MVIAKCTDCNTAFRAGKAKETLCAPCEVKNQPVPSDPQKDDVEFNQFAANIYGDIQPANKLKLEDVFNHEARLQALSAKAKNIKDTKKRKTRNQEIGRLLEEHNAVQGALADMQKRFLRATMFPESAPVKQTKHLKSPKKATNTGSTSSFPSPAKQDRNNNIKLHNGDGPDSVQPKQFETPPSPEPSSQIEDKILLSSPVKQTAAFFEKACAKRVSTEETASLSPKKSSPKPTTPVKTVQSTSKPLATVTEGSSFSSTPPRDIEKELVELEDEEILLKDDTPSEVSEDDSQVPQLGRSNSVRNRIKAFEEISRRASTGSWDRNSKAKQGIPC